MERTNERTEASTLKEKLRENFWVKKLSRDEQLELSLTVGQIFCLDCYEQVFSVSVKLNIYVYTTVAFLSVNISTTAPQQPASEKSKSEDKFATF
jgi:hypothetical protein